MTDLSKLLSEADDQRLVEAIEDFAPSEQIAEALVGNVISTLSNILAERGLVVVPGWQPIETAPRDGTRVLLLTGRIEVAVGRWHDNSRTIFPWAGWHTDLGPSSRATHWMPLPPSPAAPKGGDADAARDQRSANRPDVTPPSDSGPSPDRGGASR